MKLNLSRNKKNIIKRLVFYYLLETLLKDFNFIKEKHLCNSKAVLQ